MKKKRELAPAKDTFGIVELEERDLQMVVAGFTENIEVKTNYGCADGCTNNCPSGCGG